MAHVKTGHEDAAARRADRATGVGVGKAHTFGREAVDVRRADLLLPVAADVSPAKVVGHYVDDIRLARGRGCGKTGGGAAQEFAS